MKGDYGISDEVGNGGDCHLKAGYEEFHAPTFKNSSTFSKLHHSNKKYTDTVKEGCQSYSNS
jgi:hypothetical protein